METERAPAIGGIGVLGLERHSVERPTPTFEIQRVGGRGQLVGSSGVGPGVSGDLGRGWHGDLLPILRRTANIRSALVANALSTSEEVAETSNRWPSPLQAATGGVRSYCGPVARGEAQEEPSFVAYITTIRSRLDLGDVLGAQRILEAIPKEFVREHSVQRLRAALAPPQVTISSQRDLDRSTEYEWLKHNRAQYVGQWVALVGNDVVATAASYRELRARVAELKLSHPPLIQHIN
jgi:hypothetical protein